MSAKIVLVRGLKCPNHGNHNDHHHEQDINPEAPKHGPHSKRKRPAAKMGLSLRCDNLIGFEQRQYDARISKVWPGGNRADRFGLVAGLIWKARILLTFH